MKLKMILALVIATGLPSAAMAQGLSPSDKLELRKACAADLESLCGNTRLGEGRMAQCIRTQADKLSQPCRDAIGRLRSDLLEGTDQAMDY